MKTPIITLLLLWSVAFAQQCPMVICIDGGNPNGNFQWSVGSPNNLGECPLCGIWDRQASFQVLDTTQLVQLISSYAPPCPQMQWKVTNGCNVVTFDTCAPLPLTGLGCVWVIDAAVLPNSQIIAYWRSDSIDSVGVLLSSIPQAGTEFDSTLYLLDTCGLPLRIEETPAPPVLKQPKEAFYYDMDDVNRAALTGIPPTPIPSHLRKPDHPYKICR